MDLLSVEAIECKKEENGKWTCDIMRKTEEPKIMVDNDKICYRVRRETVKNVDDVHIMDGVDIKCSILDDGLSNFIRCEST